MDTAWHSRSSLCTWQGQYPHVQVSHGRSSQSDNQSNTLDPYSACRPEELTHAVVVPCRLKRDAQSESPCATSEIDRGLCDKQANNSRNGRRGPCPLPTDSRRRRFHLLFPFLRSRAGVGPAQNRL